MYFGYAPLAVYTFLAVGFAIVMVVGIAFGFVYLIGATRGQRAARMWTDAWIAVLALAAFGDVAWAVMTGQLGHFLAEFGVGPLAEMILLAFLFLFTMWFMAIRYTQSLKK